MKTEQIRLVLAIAREKSINKAAASLYLSQPTASSMLKALEAELGYPLFRRTRTGMLLTEEGCEFLEYAGAINRSLQAISQIRQPVKRIAAPQLRHLFPQGGVTIIDSMFLHDT